MVTSILEQTLSISTISTCTNSYSHHSISSPIRPQPYPSTNASSYKRNKTTPLPSIWQSLKNTILLTISYLSNTICCMFFNLSLDMKGLF